MREETKLLLIEDNPGDARLIAETLKETTNVKIDFHWEESLADGIERLGSESFDIVFIDPGLPDSRELNALNQIKKQAPSLPVVIITGQNNQETGLQAVREGAQDYILKGSQSHDSLERVIRYAIERKRAEEALHKNHEMLKLTEAMANIGSWEWDVQLDRAYWSEELFRIFGRDPAEGAPALAEQSKIYGDGDIQGLRCAVEKCIKFGKPYEIEVRAIRTDGEIRYCVSRGVPLYDENGKVVRLVGCFQDITERKMAQKEKEDLQNRLIQAQKMESFGQLAGGIAHDFNNLLSSILGYTELALEDAEEGSGMEEFLKEVFTAGKRAGELVRQILAFARQSDEEVTPVRISPIAKEVMKLIKSSTPSTIEIKQTVNSNAFVMGNAVQIHQIMMNLCTNAVHAMENDGGILQIGLDEIIFPEDHSASEGAIPAGKYVKLTVSDTGTGIPDEIIESIFEPYFTTKPLGEGTGMGLAMVYGILERYGGMITVDSALSEGTVFTVYLPVTEQKSESEPRESLPLPAGNESILFVDDEPPIAKMGKRILEDLGYSVTTMTNSLAALRYFTSNPEFFDLVITDMTMPNMKGDALAIELLKIRPDLPVIMCTGFSKKITDTSVKELGVKTLLYKPIIKEDLARIVRQLLDEAK